MIPDTCAALPSTDLFIVTNLSPLRDLTGWPVIPVVSTECWLVINPVSQIYQSLTLMTLMSASSVTEWNLGLASTLTFSDPLFGYFWKSRDPRRPSAAYQRWRPL